MRIIFILLIPTFLFIGCNKEVEKGSLEVELALQYGDEPFEMFKTYTYPETNQKLFFSRLSYFLSDVNMMYPNGEKNQLVDIDYINLTSEYTAPLSGEGHVITFSDLEAGAYKDFSFSIGVPSEMNKKQPSDYLSTSVLSNVAEYWSGWSSYIFFRPEGLYSDDPQKDPFKPFALHLGSDTAYIQYTIPDDIVVEANKTKRIKIIFDLEKFFNGNSVYNINKTAQIHSLSQLDDMAILAENMKRFVFYEL